MNEQKLRRIIKEEIKQQFLNESTQEELVMKTLNVLEGLKALKEEAKLFSNNAQADPDYEGEAEFMLYYSISEAVKEINKALTRFKRIKR
jgi:cell division protein ZapA (FtsZ GTPase activity inhibitor)